jgi:hypothetical protein
MERTREYLPYMGLGLVGIGAKMRFDSLEKRVSDLESLDKNLALSYILYDSGVKDALGRPIIKAKNGLTGKVEYSGTASEVITAVIGSGRRIFFKKGLYLLESPIVVNVENVTFEGEGWQTEIRASSSMSSMFDISATRYIKFRNLYINGYGLADKCINGARTSASVIHGIYGCKIWGAITCGVDFTGCEDSIIFDTWIDGRKDLTEPPVVYTSYGIMFGPAQTQGHVKLINVLVGFCKKADIYANHIRKLDIIGCLMASHKSYSADLEANLIIQGGTATLPTVSVNHTWIENDGAIPNILIKTTQAKQLVVMNSLLATGEHPNIYSTLSPALLFLSVVGSALERGGTSGYHIACPAWHMNVLNTEFYAGDPEAVNKVDVSAVNYYWLCHTGIILSNLFRAGWATIPSGSNSVTVNHGCARTPTVVITGSHPETSDAVVTSVTSTSFTITVPSNVTANRTIYWIADASK